MSLSINEIPPSPDDRFGSHFFQGAEGDLKIDRGGEQRCEFSIPKEKAGLIIGKGGETLRALEEEFQLHIHVEKVQSSAVDSSRTVVIIGDESDSVFRARDKIQIMIAGSIISDSF